jgi:hypothetical protein
MNWKLFLQSLAAAAIGGAATSVTQVVADPGHTDFTHMGPVAGVGALVGVLGFLKQSPAPPPPPAPGSTTSNFPSSK